MGKLPNEEEIDKVLDETKALATMTLEKLRVEANLGMKKVDPADIRPPQILLVQKTSDLSQMQPKDGQSPNVGQFYHTGKQEIYDSFDCHILFAAKSKFTNRLHND